MNTLSPRAIRTILIAGATVLGLSLAFSAFSVARVLSAPLATTVTVPSTVGFEGYLVDEATGEPLDGFYDLTFSVYDTSTTSITTSIWFEAHDDVDVVEGIYALELGGSEPFSTDTFDGDRWIGVQVMTYTELAPRIKVSSVPFALNADYAINAGNADYADDAGDADTVDGLDVATSGADAHVLATGSNGGATISGGVNVGSASGAGAGDVRISGSVEQSTALGCRVIRNTSQSIPNAAWTTLIWTTELHDTDSCWTSGGHLYARTAGYYMAGASVGFEPSASGQRLVMIRQNGSTQLAWVRYPSTTWQNMSIASGMFYMGVNDYIDILVFQDSGSSLNVPAASSTLQMNAVGWLVRIP